MPPINIQLDALKTILDNLFQPQRLEFAPLGGQFDRA